MILKSKVFILTILLIIVSLLILPVSADAKTITVGQSGLADYDSINEADFWANDGDTIVVSSGIYHEKIEIQRNVTLIAKSKNPEDTILQSTEIEGPTILIWSHASNVTIEGFTIRGYFDDSRKQSFTGISVTAGSNIIRNNIIENYRYDGIGLSTSGNSIYGNTISNTETGIRSGRSSQNLIYDNLITNNQYGMRSYDASYNTIKSNRFIDNEKFDVLFNGGKGNLIYNNIFTNVNNENAAERTNIWNVTKRDGTNIIGGDRLGGNYWAGSNETGFSQTCEDVNYDGFADEKYKLNFMSSDYLPLVAAEEDDVSSKLSKDEDNGSLKNLIASLLNALSDMLPSTRRRLPASLTF